jgi:hypothetical protein
MKITERGFAGHFCGSTHCRYRRNTLVEFQFIKIVISTVGNYHHSPEFGSSKVNCDSYYETMVFESIYEEPYWEADVTKQIHQYRLITTEILYVSDYVVDQFHNNLLKGLEMIYYMGLLESKEDLAVFFNNIDVEEWSTKQLNSIDIKFDKPN